MCAAPSQPAVRPRPVTPSVICFDCGAPMRERLRLKERGMVFVWFECTQRDCVGQLLRKQPEVVEYRCEC